ncbi:MAG TPA: polysaccharide deacetylase family protein [bacterium]|nr:polysaccharide deacetylase family protein [bacterium]HOX85841.1 polysaccharide deacetylase family protein [bacterium]HPG45176.1 polysaccharide deacetylase family protein [bacterium]HPM97418.1 polysaccharide deacetylase family protein [bacterium]
MKKLLKTLACAMIYYSGLFALIHKYSARRGVTILAYHRICSINDDYLNLAIPIDAFHNHLEVLAKHYRVVSLERAIALLMEKKITNSVVITFDDGYRDNYTNAYPLLKKYGFPWTLFVTVNPVKNQLLLWYDSIKTLYINTAQDHVDLTDFGMPVFPLRNRREKIAALHKTLGLIKKNPVFGRMDDFVRSLEKQLQCSAVSSATEAMLTFAQLREMQRAGVTIGSHTMNHPILAQIESNHVRDEIERSKQMLEQELEQPVDYFAYPNGAREDFDDQIIDNLKSVGYRGACTLIPGINSDDDLFNLKRVGIDQNFVSFAPFLTRALFAVEMTGILDRLLMRSMRTKLSSPRIFPAPDSGVKP